MYKNYLLLFFIFSLCFSAFAQDGLTSRELKRMSGKVTAKGDLSSVCTSVQPISALWKITAGGHVTGGPRVTGFSLICNARECPKSFPASFYYSDGTLAGMVGYYGRWIGNGKARAYGGTNGAPQHWVKTIRKNANRSGRNGYLYINMGAYCASVLASANRSGSPF